jgi:hypothetical protein
MAKGSSKKAQVRRKLPKFAGNESGMKLKERENGNT